MSSRSERYLANAEKCQQCADAAYTSGTKSLYGELASQWRRLAEQADGTDQSITKMQIQMMDQMMDAWEEQIRSPNR